MSRFYISDGNRPAQCSPVAEYGTAQRGRSVYTEDVAHRNGRRNRTAYPWVTAAAKLSKNTNGPAAVSWTDTVTILQANRVAFNTVEHDPAAGWDAGTSEWVAPIAGLAVVSGWLRGASTRPAAARSGAAILKNGGQVAGNLDGSGGGNSDSSSTTYHVFVTAIVPVVVGDRLAIAPIHVNGAWSHVNSLGSIDCGMTVGVVPTDSGVSFVDARCSTNVVLTPQPLAAATPFLFGAEQSDTHNEYDPATGLFTASRRCVVLSTAASSVSAATVSNSPRTGLTLCKHDSAGAVVDYSGPVWFKRMHASSVNHGFSLRAEAMFFLDAGEKVSAKVYNESGTAVSRTFFGGLNNSLAFQRLQLIAFPV